MITILYNFLGMIFQSKKCLIFILIEAKCSDLYHFHFGNTMLYKT